MSMEVNKTPSQNRWIETLKENLHKELQIPLAILFGILIGIMCMLVLSHSNVIDLSTKHYVYVDVERIISEVNDDLLEQIKNNKIDDKVVEVKLAKSKAKFDNLSEIYTKTHNAVVFSSTKVISGAEDITEYFISEIKGIE